jgi:hypothetical protein
MGRSGRSYSAFGLPVDGRRPITGGLFARGAGGRSVGRQTTSTRRSWSKDSPRFWAAAFWRVEAWLHDVIGRRFLARATR